MIKLIKKITFVLCVILVVVFIIVNNHTDTKLIFWPNKSVQTGLGIVLITSFVFGFLIATIIGSYFSFKSYLKEKKLLKERSKQETVSKKILEARVHTCLKDYDKAIKLWNDLIKIEKTFLVPYIEIAKIYIEKGDYNSSLKILQTALNFSNNNKNNNGNENEEVLFYLALTHNLLQNNASALNYYTRIYGTKPCALIAKLARDEAISIKQYDDALLYQKSLNSLVKDKDKNAIIKNDDKESDKENDIENNIENNIKYLKILKETKDGSDEQISRLKEFHKIAPSHIDTGLKLSELLLKKEDVKQALLVLTKVATNSKKAFLWKRIIDIWIESNEPKKAISAINTAIKEANSKEMIKTYFIAIESFIKLSMLDDARAYFEMLEKYVKDNNIEFNEKEKLLFEFSNNILFSKKNISNINFSSFLCEKTK
ncbi:MAG: hypothetical protein ACOX3T_07625 [Bdellovibrionota bacterium]